MEHPAVITQKHNLDKIISIIATEIDVAADQSENEPSRFKAVLLDHLNVQLLNDGNLTILRSLADRGEIPEAAGVMRFMKLTEYRFRKLFKEERLAIIAAVVEILAQDVYPKMIEGYLAKIPIAR